MKKEELEKKNKDLDEINKHLEERNNQLEKENIQLKRMVKSLDILDPSMEANAKSETDIKNLFSFLAYEKQEHLYLALTNNRFNIYKTMLMYKGTLTECIAGTRDIIYEALISNAKGVLIIHNHPSGELDPSDADFMITRRLEESCRVFDIDFIAHYIITKNNGNIKLIKIEDY